MAKYTIVCEDIGRAIAESDVREAVIFQAQNWLSDNWDPDSDPSPEMTIITNDDSAISAESIEL